MALAWLRDLGQHIGKIPGAPLIPGDRHQPRIREWSGASGTSSPPVRAPPCEHARPVLLPAPRPAPGLRLLREPGADELR